MSVLFHQIPSAYSPGFNDLIFVVSSTAAHNTQFRFKSDIKDESGDIIATFYNVKQPTYGNLLFDAHRTIERYLTYDISNLIAQTTGWQKGVNVFKKFTLAVTEEYPNTVFHTSGTSSSIYAVNSAMTFQDWVNDSLSLSGRLVGNSSRRWLTNQPETIRIRENDSYELGIIIGSTPLDETLKYLKIETYNSSGTLLKTATVNNGNYLLPDDGSRFPSILVGPDDLNNTTLSTGTQPLVASNTEYYRVACFDSTNVQSSQWKYFKLDRSCLRDTYVRLYWLNPLGRIDGFNFNFVFDDEIEVTKARYDKLLGNLTSTAFSYNNHQQQTSVFHSKVKQKYKLRSDYLSDEESIWLKELIASPYVLMEVPIVGGTTFVSVVVDDSQYKANNTLVDKLKFIELNVSLSVQSQRQRL